MADEEKKEKEEKEKDEIITYFIQPEDVTMDVIWEINTSQKKNKK